MSTGAIIAIVIIVLIVLALVMWLGKRRRDTKLQSRRHEAREIRSTAEVRTAEADKMRAEADERAARARREEAQAREQAVRAEEQRREAETHHARAHDVDPDTKGDYDPDQERTTTDTTPASPDPDRTAREGYEERTAGRGEEPRRT